VNAHTEYGPLPGSTPTQYTQDVYTANLLSQILKANKSFFEPVPGSSPALTTTPDLPLPLPAKPTLKQLVELGIVNPDASWPVFAALWVELTQPGRPPIMLAIDGLAHVMRNSEYLSADVKPIHAHDLTLIRHFMDHLSGKVSLPNGGMVLAATSKSNAPSTPALDFSIQLSEARKRNEKQLPIWNPYKVADQRVMEVLRNVDVLKVGGLSKEEARALIEYYAASGMLRAKVDEPFVTEKWSLAGMGNVGELERATVRLRV
jgi:small subunit ribosomal protein S29